MKENTDKRPDEVKKTKGANSRYFKRNKVPRNRSDLKNLLQQKREGKSEKGNHPIPQCRQLFGRRSTDNHNLYIGYMKLMSGR